MRLVYKQIAKELFKNLFSVILIFLLVFFTSFMYFFVHFSIDGNMIVLNALSSLSENQVLYKNALSSNTILARNMLIASILLTSFVYFVFFQRFYKKNSKDLGCFKALGIKDYSIASCFAIFSAIISVLGGLIGLIIGYFASDILIEAGIKSYEVSCLVKSVTLISVIIGIFLPAAVFCLVALITYFMICSKETALLLFPRSDTSSSPLFLRIAHKLASLCPGKNKFAVRLALRKPVALLLILIAVISFSVMFMMAYSLNLSSSKIYESQMLGHHYLFDVHLDAPTQLENPLSYTMPYLDAYGNIETEDFVVNQQIISFEHNSSLFELMDDKGNLIPTPKAGEIVISPALRDLYNITEKDSITLCIQNSRKTFIVSAIAYNAKLNSVYIAPVDLEAMMALPEHSYTGIWSMEKTTHAVTAITRERKIADLERNLVSNRTSAIINQVVGCLIGCILLFLALLLNFQDNTEDMLILSMMGKSPRAIRKTLIDIYLPIVCIFFIVGLWPSVQIVKAILRSLSLQIGDYMPFQTNPLVIAGIFMLLNITYMLVQFTFSLGIKKVINADNVYAYISNEFT